jgi:hypothetical protein
MTKKQGFKVRIDAFVEIDKKDYGKQAAAYAMMDAVTKSGKLPADFWTSAVILGISATPGGAEVPDAPKNDGGGPADVPLTTDPLPEGAIVLEATTGLDGLVFQTVRLADGTEVGRRISAEQDATEQASAGKSGKTGKAK